MMYLGTLNVVVVANWLRSFELADELGVSRQTINAIETGKYDPSLEIAFKFAGLFKARMEDIFQP